MSGTPLTTVLPFSICRRSLALLDLLLIQSLGPGPNGHLSAFHQVIVKLHSARALFRKGSEKHGSILGACSFAIGYFKTAAAQTWSQTSFVTEYFFFLPHCNVSTFLNDTSWKVTTIFLRKTVLQAKSKANEKRRLETKTKGTTLYKT